MEELAGVKCKTGVICPDKDDPSKCFAITLETVNLGYIPEFAIKMLVKNLMMGKLEQLVAGFKKSSVYEKLI